MVVSLLPASAAAFAPRSAPTIVLTTVEGWLTTTLRRIRRIKRPSNNVSQHVRVLSEVLGGPDAIWSLCAIMVPRAPDSQLTKDPSNPLIEAFNYRLIHISAYVVHVDMVSQNEVAFKLTSDTISALIQYHRDVYLIDAAASTCDWPGKSEQVQRLHEDFIQAVNRHVFRTDKQALEGMEECGTGELLEGRSWSAQNGVLNLFMPLNPPPPSSDVFDIMIQTSATSGESQAEQPGWVPVVPSQGVGSQAAGHGPNFSIVPSQQVSQCNQQSVEAPVSDFSDLYLDLDFSTINFPYVSEGQGTISSLELPSPALTLNTSQLLGSVASPTSPSFSLSSPNGSVSFDNAGLYFSTMAESISPLSASAGFSDLSTPMLTPCGQEMPLMAGIDLSTLLSEGWPGAESILSQYGATV